MHLKLVFSLAFLALCSARSIDYDYYVNVEDGHVTVQNKDGQEVDIYVKQHVGKSGHYIQIHVTGPGVVLHSQKYISEPASFEGQYQADILHQIFNKYQGSLDEASYEKLLNHIAQHVEENNVHPAVLYALQKLSPHHQTANLISPVHQDIYNTIQKLFQHVGFDQAVQVPYKHGVLGDASNIHEWDQEAHGSQYPGIYGSRRWAHYPGVSGVKSWAHQYGSEYPSVYGTKSWAQQYGSHYPGVSGVQNWEHQYGSEYPSVYGTKSWAHQYGSHYPSVSSVQNWEHQYGSEYPSVYGSKSWAHQYGSHYPSLSGVQSWEHQYGSEYQSPYGTKSWAHQYGSHYPEVAGVQDWTEEGYRSHYPGVYGSAQSYGGYYGPFSSDVYDSGVAHGYGQHHYSSAKQWPHGDSWTHPIHHELVAY